MLGEDKGYGQRRSIAGTRKRRSSTHASMFAPTPLPSARASLNPASLSSTDVDPSVRPPPDTQHYKRISKRERHLRETAQCGFENLELVNLIGRAFLFFGKIYFRCPRCVVPSIATYHCSKFGGDPDFVLTCTFCKTTISDAAKGTTKPLEPLAPTRRFHCVICEHSKVYLATALETVLVYDDDDPLAPRLRMHQFCRQHNRLVFSSAGRVLHMSTIRKALAENWTSRWDTKSGGRR